MANDFPYPRDALKPEFLAVREKIMRTIIA
jgi:hypothetical protein